MGEGLKEREREREQKKVEKENWVIPKCVHELVFAPLIADKDGQWWVDRGSGCSRRKELAGEGFNRLDESNRKLREEVIGGSEERDGEEKGNRWWRYNDERLSGVLSVDVCFGSTGFKHRPPALTPPEETISASFLSASFLSDKSWPNLMACRDSLNPSWRNDVSCSLFDEDLGRGIVLMTGTWWFSPSAVVADDSSVVKQWSVSEWWCESFPVLVTDSTRRWYFFLWPVLLFKISLMRKEEVFFFIIFWYKLSHS